MARKKSAHEVTIVDVAEASGVSYSTVSRVVNNKENVKKETRERVLRAMEELGYEANLQARSLAGGRTNIIGLLVVDLATQYMSAIIRGMDEVLAANRRELVLYTTHHRLSKESAYVNMLARGVADGMVIVLPREPESYLSALRQRDFPYVLFDQMSINEHDLSVTAANEEGGYAATRHLIDLGHQHIGMITGLMDMVSARHRLDGYRKALDDHGIPYDEELVYEGDFTEASGVCGAEYLLALPQPPTAVFASNDESAVGFMEVLRARNLRVPDDISIVGFDDVPIAKLVTPQLTTVRQPLVEMGRRAMQMLIDLIEKPEEKQHSIVLPTELIVRESTAVPAKVSYT